MALPLGAMTFVSVQRLQEEAFLQQRFNAQQTAEGIVEKLGILLQEEESRPFDHYSYLMVSPAAGTLQRGISRSPLAEIDRVSFPGLVGYFQIAPNGALTSPLLPTEGDPAAIDVPQRESRTDRFRLLESILTRAAPIPTSSKDSKREADTRPGSVDAPVRSFPDAQDRAPLVSQEAIISGASRSETEGRVKVGRDPGAKLSDRDDKALREREIAKTRLQIPRKETANSIVLDDRAGGVTAGIGNEFEHSVQAKADVPRPKITTFEAEVDPLQATRLPDGHLVLFRKAWRGEKRFIQGCVVDTGYFMERLIADGLTTGTLPAAASALLLYSGDPLLRLVQPQYDFSSAVSLKKVAKEQSLSQAIEAPSAGIVLFRMLMSEPLSDFELMFTVNNLPSPPGGVIVLCLGAILSLLLILGSIWLYRLGSAQIALAEKRSDFVSAVSHELKTPLTSIRMYGEMLKNGWVVEEEKKQSYYGFIFDESERLSRLIANVLRFSRLTGSSEALAPEQRQVSAVLAAIVEKVEPMARAAAFSLEIVCEPEAQTLAVKVDDDAMSQIAINLVDNALKFSRDAERKEIQVGFRLQAAGTRCVFFVRDFGKGVPKSEQRKIFELFYRSESELTRKTSGTGIGLALVRELALRMGAKIDYRSREPGAEFQVVFEVV